MIIIKTFKYKLRIATLNDFDFLFDLNVQTMKENVEKTWGKWDHHFQIEYFRNHFNPEKSQIIVLKNKDIGVLIEDQDDSKVYIDEIKILPEYQGKGIGTAILTEIIEKAREKNLEVKLQVLKVNEKAKKLYERLGFELFGETKTHFLMKLK